MCCFASLRRVLYFVTAVSTAMGTGTASALEFADSPDCSSVMVDTAPCNVGESALQPTALRVKRVGSNVEIRGDAAGDTETQLTRFVYFSPDAKKLLILRAGNDRTSARVWDVGTGEPASPRLKHSFVLFDAAISRDGKTALVASLATSHLWNTESGKRIGPPLRQRYRRTHGVAISPSGETVLTDGRWLWDARSGKRLAVSLQHPEGTYAVRHAAFSPDGSTILTAAENGTVQLWDATTGVAMGPPLRHREAVRHTAFSPDGKIVATACRDNVARIWNPRTGELLTTLVGHQGDIHQTAWSPDGEMLLTGSADGTARLWDRMTGEQLAAPIPHDGAVRAVCFSADGGTFLTWNFSKIHRWATPASSATNPNE